MEAPVTDVPPAKRWWAPGADPDVPRIGVRRAVVEVTLVYLAFFAAGVVAAGLIVGGHSHDFPTDGSWGVYMTETVSVLSEMGLAVAVVILLAGRRGVSPAALGLSVPRLPDGRVAVSAMIRMAAWCFVAIGVGLTVTGLLETGHLPKGHTSAPLLIIDAVHSVDAGVVEELVVLAFVVVTLRQAGLSWAVVTPAALVLRAAYHIYYGPGVVGILIWAALFFWIYLRFRTIVPLIICHAYWDIIVSLG
ncbi:MAG TPA: CPBP family intramembrane glutamic endopeptidase, partial [Acidimicrobiales bacterium]|nr:CPBP family intramembrane glutamic endopeptidase [Acidimicrobiales bacterium]